MRSGQVEELRCIEVEMEWPPPVTTALEPSPAQRALRPTMWFWARSPGLATRREIHVGES
jgi:hypothetical protein